MKILIFGILIILAFVIVGGGYMFFVACARGKEYSWLDKEALQGTAYEKYADYIQRSNQWLTEHTTQDVYITSTDGLRLHGVWVPAENPKGTVLLAHGYRSTMLVDFGLVFELYHSLGMNLLIPHQRCHGSSEGRYITFGVKESLDMECWIRYLHEELKGGETIISGLSMGASTVLYLADRKLPQVKGIIADCGFTSPAAILSKVFTSVTHLPAIPTIWAADLFARVFAGFSLYSKDTRKILKNSIYPVLMVHGVKDDFVPCDMTKEGYEVCAEPKQLLLAEEAGHGTSFLKEPEKYETIVIKFLQTNLEGFS